MVVSLVKKPWYDWGFGVMTDLDTYWTPLNLRRFSELSAVTHCSYRLGSAPRVGHPSDIGHLE